MSGIAALLHLDGRPADAALLRQLTDAVASRGPDGAGQVVDGPAGLGHRMLHTTAESTREAQPWADETGALRVVLDGRVDNREELAARLAAAGVRPRSDGDAELVLRAYACWGDDCPARIVGDFAFAIWDRRRGRLFGARDPAGVRPFYYHADGRTLVCGSALRQVLAAPGAPGDPNEAMLGEYLSDAITSTEETLYRAVRRLPPAHALAADAGGVRTWRYHRLDPGRTVRCGSDREYAERLAELLREAVRCRLRSVSPVSVFLSGGLDSSTIAGLAVDLVRRGTVADRGLEAWSLAFAHPAADERAYVDDVVRMGGLKHHSIAAEAWTPPPLAERVARLRDFPDLPNASPWLRLCALARDRGSRVVLWGHGGDEWLTGDVAHNADLLRAWRVPALVRQLRADLRVCRGWGGGAVGARDAVRWCLSPLLPAPVRSVLRRALGSEVPRWIAPAFARRIGLRDRLHRPAAPAGRLPTAAQQAIAAQLDSGWGVLEYELLDRLEAEASVEGRFPFQDRRVIEFALALPEAQRWRGDQPKFALREAARGLVPESVRRRTTKADFSHLYAEAFAREPVDSVFASLRLAADGYVLAPEARRLYRAACRGDVAAYSPAWMILGAEHWYRSLEGTP